MNRICTSIEQSKKLIELGIDRNTADMYYTSEYVTPSVITGSKDDYSTYIPAWSLSALMELIPRSIISKPNPFSTSYCCRNTESDIESDIEFYTCNITFTDFIDAAFEMVCWLKKENRI